MSSPDDIAAQLANRPDTVFVDGVGEVPVIYQDDHAESLPLVGPTDVLRHAEGVSWIAVGHELVVYDAAAQTTHVLDSVSGLLWQCLDGSGSLGEIFPDLASVFGITLTVVEEDLAPVVATWLRDGLILNARPSATDTASTEAPAHADGWRMLVDPPNN